MTRDILTQINDNPLSSGLYHRLIANLADIGPYTLDPKQTSLHITNGKRAFLGVYPRSNGLLLSVVSDHLIDSDRFKKVEQLSKNRYHYDLVVTSAEEFDDELMGWIGDAYRL
jgi:hypothetical protein